METTTSVLVLGLVLIPLMMFFPTAMEMIGNLYSMSTALVGMPF